jgi:DNA-binding Lrp family transcriptional regulator
MPKRPRKLGNTSYSNVKNNNLTNTILFAFDSLDKSIIKELVRDADFKSAKISSKYKIPLSTIQRRRTKLEHSVIKKDYKIDIQALGVRTANLLIGVGKGGSEDIAGKIIQKHNKNVMSTTLVVGNPQINLSANIYYKSSTELHNLLEDIKSMPNVNYIEWYEIVRVVEDNRSAIVHALIN